MRRGVLAALLFLSSCRTVREEIGQEGGTLAHELLQTSDGASIDFWRWAPRGTAAPKVLVLPELGFDHRLVTPLCVRLRDAGYDVATLDGREVTHTNGRYSGLAGWTIDAARALAAHGPKPVVVAVGVGGTVAFQLAAESRGLVVVNVPARWAVGNEAVRLALAVHGYDPLSWMNYGIGSLLLGGGRSTPPNTTDRLRSLARHPSAAMSDAVAAAFRSGATAPTPTVPVRVLVGVKDNLVAGEDALPDGGRAFTHVRRLARVEGFQRDYGHLDWLVDPDGIAEVTAAIVAEIEGLP